jgi:hypothetical protein
MEPGPPVADVVSLRGTFAGADVMQVAIERLMVAGFDRADLSLPNRLSPSGDRAADSGARSADTEDDARPARCIPAEQRRPRPWRRPASRSGRVVRRRQRSRPPSRPVPQPAARPTPPARPQPTRSRNTATLMQRKER